MTETERPIKILLIMHSTRSDNLGVGALTAAQVALLRDISKDIGRRVEITSMDWVDPREPYISGDDITVRDLTGKVMRSPSGYFAQARRADLVIDIGAGDSFADIYGSARLKRMFVLKYLTHLSGTPLVLAPQTYGPFYKGWSKALARFSIQKSAVVAARDEKSAAAVRALGVTSDVIAASDLAMLLPYARPEPRRDGPRRVGLNVSGLLMSGGYQGQNDFGLSLDYPGLIRRMIRFFQDQEDPCEVHLVPHVVVRQGALTMEDDMTASQQLASEFPGTICAPEFATPSDAKSYIAGMDFFLGARMHACIAAFSAGVPVVPMAYSRKFAGLFGTLGYHRTVDCTSEAEDAVFQKVVTAFNERDILADEVTTAFAKAEGKVNSYKDAVRSLLLRISEAMT